MSKRRTLGLSILLIVALAGFAFAGQKSDKSTPPAKPYSFNLHGPWVTMGSSVEAIKSLFPEAKGTDSCQPLVPFDDQVTGVPSASTNLTVQLSSSDCANFRFSADRLTYVELITTGTAGAGPVVDSFEKDLMKLHGKGKVKDKNPPYVHTEWAVSGTRIIRYDYFSESGDSFTNFRLITK